MEVNDRLTLIRGKLERKLRMDQVTLKNIKLVFGIPKDKDIILIDGDNNIEIPHDNTFEKIDTKTIYEVLVPDEPPPGREPPLAYLHLEAKQDSVRWDASSWAPVTSALELRYGPTGHENIAFKDSRLAFSTSGLYWLQFDAVGWNVSGLRSFRLRKGPTTVLSESGFSSHCSNGGFFQNGLHGIFSVQGGEELELEYMVTGTVHSWGVSGNSCAVATLSVFKIAHK
eukprot:TRINITY_DN2364_c0_g1_i1.p1 TRINITY_DN2364_c0_g1~~TRINITY_DN2364_c0_g1_i1.p1  ORF type:complete len:227 (-),score=16.20 TRINITY_DN2364_c0_g1_i1:72-752(-)